MQLVLKMTVSAALFGFTYNAFASSFACGEQASSSGSNDKITIVGQAIDSTTLANVKVSIETKGAPREVLSTNGQVSSIDNHSKKKPLNGLTKFRLSDSTGDTFDFYLPADFLQSSSASFTGFLRVAFDKGYPKVSPVDCHLE